MRRATVRYNLTSSIHAPQTIHRAIQGAEVAFMLSNVISLGVGVALVYFAFIHRVPDEALAFGAGAAGILLVLMTIIDMAADTAMRIVAFNDNRRPKRTQAMQEPEPVQADYFTMRSGNQPPQLVSKVETEAEREYSELRSDAMKYILACIEYVQVKVPPEDPNTSRLLAGHRLINWEGARVKKARDILAPYVDNQGSGKGAFIAMSSEYKSLAALYDALDKRTLQLASLKTHKQLYPANKQ